MRVRKAALTLHVGECVTEGAGHVTGAPVKATKAGKLTSKCDACVKAVGSQVAEAQGYLDRRVKQLADFTWTGDVRQFPLRSDGQVEREAKPKKAKSTSARKSTGKGKRKGGKGKAKSTPADLTKLTKAQLIEALKAQAA